MGCVILSAKQGSTRGFSSSQLVLDEEYQTRENESLLQTFSRGSYAVSGFKMSQNQRTFSKTTQPWSRLSHKPSILWSNVPWFYRTEKVIQVPISRAFLSHELFLCFPQTVLFFIPPGQSCLFFGAVYTFSPLEGLSPPLGDQKFFPKATSKVELRRKLDWGAFCPVPTLFAVISQSEDPSTLCNNIHVIRRPDLNTSPFAL